MHKSGEYQKTPPAKMYQKTRKMFQKTPCGGFFGTFWGLCVWCFGTFFWGLGLVFGGGFFETFWGVYGAIRGILWCN